MIRIFEWEVVPETCTLHRIETEEETHLSPRGMEVLVYLAENHGKVVSSHELLEKFWAKSVVSDHAVHNVIAEIRAALGDSASKPRYIKTFPKRGYSLIIETPLTSHSTNGSVKEFAPKITSWIASTIPSTSISRLVATCLLLGIVLGVAFIVPGLDLGESEESSGIPSLVVIPFDYSNITEENRSWVGQFVQQLPSVIAKIPDIQIKKGPNSADATDFINQNQQLADYVLHGNVVQANDQLRLNLELIDTIDGTVPFSDKFDLGSEAVFSVQDEITSQVVTALSIYLNDNERNTMLDWGTKNASAYKHFQKAEFHALQLNGSDLDLAIKNYTKAIDEDPDFLNAYLGLANTASRKALFSDSKTVAELSLKVSSALREIIRLGADEESMHSSEVMALTVEGTNQTLIEQKLRELILEGNAPEFAYAHYAFYLTSARMYDEAQLLLQFTHEGESFVISPDARWNYPSRVETPMNLVTIKKQQLLKRPSHLSLISSLIRSAAFTGDFELANKYLERQLQLDNDGLFAMLDQVVVSALAGSSIEAGDRLESEKLGNPDYNFSYGAKRFILGDIEGGIALWRSLNAADTRRMFLFIDTTEIFFPLTVIEDPRYQAMLDEIGVGISWQRKLTEGVLQMSDVIGVTLNAKSQAAYDADVFMPRNNLWDHHSIPYPHATPPEINTLSTN